MLAKIKQCMSTCLASIAAATLLLITIPITIGITLIMLFVAMFTQARVSHHLRKSAVIGDLPIDTRTAKKATEKMPQKPPIEGSYRIINK